MTEDKSELIAPSGASPVCEICGRASAGRLYIEKSCSPECYRLGYERVRSRLSTAEKALEVEIAARNYQWDKRKIAEKERLRLSALAAELHQGQCASYRDLLDTVRSISRMLGWENPPPRESLEANLRALRARLEKAEADLSRSTAGDVPKAPQDPKTPEIPASKQG